MEREAQRSSASVAMRRETPVLSLSKEPVLSLPAPAKAGVEARTGALTAPPCPSFSEGHPPQPVLNSI